MPGDWPRYMSERRLRDGGIAYYWAPQTRDLRAGCPLHAEALGRDLQQARDRADMLNRALDDWRNGRGADRDLDMQPGFGTLDWLVERYRRSPAWDKVSDRARPDYTYVMQLVLDLPRKSGTRVGEARLASIDAAAADKIYERMKTGPRGPRVRVATQAMMRLARAWDVVHRLHRRDVPADNPFRGIALEHGRGTARAASFADAIALHEALIAAGGAAESSARACITRARMARSW